MVLPQPFTTTSQTIATFDFTDLATGLGYENFFAGATQNDSATNFVLTSNSFKDQLGLDHVRTSSDTSLSKDVDLTFDSSGFNLPRTIDGEVICAIPYHIKNEGGSTSLDVFSIITLYRVRATVETSLGTIQSGTITAATGGAGEGYMTTKFTVDKALIQEGDILRFDVEVWAVRTGASNSWLLIPYNTQDAAIPAEDNAGNEGQQQTVAAGNSQMVFQIPFKNQGI